MWGCDISVLDVNAHFNASLCPYLLDGMQVIPGVFGIGLAIERSQLSLSCPRMHLSSGHSWRTQLYMKAYSIILSAPAASSCTVWRTA